MVTKKTHLAKKHWYLSKIAAEQSEVAGRKSYESTVALFLKSRGLDIGSGVLVSYKGKCYIATAAHNVRNLKKENIFIAHKDNDLVRENFQGKIHFHPNKNLDLACLCINSREFIRAGKVFIDVTGMKFNYKGFPNKKYWACVTGFPAHFTERKVRINGSVFIGGGKTLWSDLSRPGKRWSQFVYLNYPKQFQNNKGTTITNPPPPGLSGGGMWVVPINPDKGEHVWSLKRMRLIGIQHTHYIAKGSLQGTKIQHLVDLVRTI